MCPLTLWTLRVMRAGRIQNSAKHVFPFLLLLFSLPLQSHYNGQLLSLYKLNIMSISKTQSYSIDTFICGSNVCLNAMMTCFWPESETLVRFWVRASRWRSELKNSTDTQNNYKRQAKWNKRTQTSQCDRTTPFTVSPETQDHCVVKCASFSCFTLVT